MMPETLLLSMREASNLVAYSHLYEFEDVVSELLSADIIKLTNHDELDFYRKFYKAAKLTIHSRPATNLLTEKVIKKSLKQPLKKDYDLLIAPFNTPYELFMLLSLGNWRDKCKKAACYIIEFWQHDLLECKYLLDFLKDFDHIFLGTRQCVKEVSEMTGKPCTYLPISVDTVRFCPHLPRQKSTIEYCNLGRRSPQIHQGLMTLAEQNKSFYYYDTISISNVANSSKQQTFSVKNPREHRCLLANLLKRSRYFIANRARANEFKKEQSKDELSSRFFEGAASGTIMLGEPPETTDFQANFGWEDAVIRVPFDCSDIASVITKLDKQPERLQHIRENNVVNSLRRHDSVYRLKEILNKSGLEATPKMLAREDTLNKLAQSYLDHEYIHACN